MTRPMTYGQALSLASVPVPGHLEAGAEVPVLTGVQAQGDILIVPLRLANTGGHLVHPLWPPGEPVGAAGVQIVRGESTGNTHWLHAGFDSPGVAFSRRTGQIVGVLTVPAGQTAMLIHTDEHGANGIGPGVYEIRRKREQAHHPRYVED
jgi:hypothetical protein